MSSRKRISQDEPTTDAATAVAEPPAVESKMYLPSFAERVGHRQGVSTPDPFAIAADTVAGVQLFESKRDRQMAIKFGEGRPEDKPIQAVIDKVKDAGYRWNPTDRIWTHPVRPDSAMTTRIDAERLYLEVRQMIRQEKGLDTGQEVPF